MKRNGYYERMWDELDEQVRARRADLDAISKRILRLVGEESVHERHCEPEHKQAVRLMKGGRDGLR